MTNIILNCLYVFCNVLLSAVVQIGFFNAVQKPKIKKIYLYLISIASSAVLYYVLTYTDISKALPPVLFHAVLIAMVIFLYEDKLVNKIVNMVVFYTLTFSLDLLSYSLVSVTKGLSDIEYNLYATFAYAAFLIIAFYFAAKFINTIKSGVAFQKCMVFLLVPLSHVLVLASIAIMSKAVYYEFYDTTTKYQLFDTKLSLVLFSAMVICLIIDIFVFKQYVKNINAAKLESENEMLKYANDMNDRYFNDLRNNEAELRKIRHDIGGALEIVKELIYKEKDIEKAKSLFDELSETVQNINTGFYTSNSLVNAVITNKAKACGQEKIKFNTEILLSEDLEIDEADLCRALVNMLDNAIEANRESGENKFVFLSMKTIGGYLYLKTENSFSGQAPDGKTTKQNKSEHGFGLKILNDFAEKYDGIFTIDADGQTVTSLLTMKNNKV